jgi:hypothetical protein
MLLVFFLSSYSLRPNNMKPMNDLRIWRVEGLMDVFGSSEVLLDPILCQWGHEIQTSGCDGCLTVSP